MTQLSSDFGLIGELKAGRHGISLRPDTYDGEAIFSGILIEERERMLDALGAYGLRVVAEDREDAWWTAAARRA